MKVRRLAESDRAPVRGLNVRPARQGLSRVALEAHEGPSPQISRRSRGTVAGCGLRAAPPQVLHSRRKDPPAHTFRARSCCGGRFGDCGVWGPWTNTGGHPCCPHSASSLRDQSLLTRCQGLDGPRQEHPGLEVRQTPLRSGWAPAPQGGAWAGPGRPLRLARLARLRCQTW